MSEVEGKASGSQSIGLAAAVLRTVGGYAAGARLADVVAKTKLTKPTAHRILVSLMREGLIEQETKLKCYFLGPETFVLGTDLTAFFVPVDLRELTLTEGAEDGETWFKRGTDCFHVKADRGAAGAWQDCGIGAQGRWGVAAELLSLA